MTFFKNIVSLVRNPRLTWRVFRYKRKLGNKWTNCITYCAACGRPIFPGMPVGQAWEEAQFPYTHLTFECCDAGALYCGRWGEGRLITLHELDPKKYPPDTTSLADHALKTGGIVIEEDIN